MKELLKVLSPNGVVITCPFNLRSKLNSFRYAHPIFMLKLDNPCSKSKRLIDRSSSRRFHTFVRIFCENFSCPYKNSENIFERNPAVQQWFGHSQFSSNNSCSQEPLKIRAPFASRWDPHMDGFILN